MSFQVIMLALGVVLIIEGIGPMLFIDRWQRYIKQVAIQNRSLLQRFGGALVTAGVVILIIFA